MPTQRDLGRHYLEVLPGRFAFTKSLADGALEQLTDAELVFEPKPGSNSVAVTMKHIAGNQLSRWTDFLTSDGEKPWRHRDTEFEDHAWTREGILAHWEKGWAALFSALEALTPEDLLSDVRIRGRAQSVVAAIERQMAHYGYHVGQIVYVARLIKGDGWQTLSVARGASSAYNADRGHGTEDDA